MAPQERNNKIHYWMRTCLGMVDTALQIRLDGIIFLLTLAVSLLSGLVFGKGFTDEIFYAVLSFVVLGIVVLVLGAIRSSYLAETGR